MRWVLAFFILLIGFCWSAETNWTHRAEEGEDASSTHYCFFQIENDEIKRIRWVWNGGAQNPPEIIDYLLSKNSVQVITYTGKRESIPQLIQGLDADLKMNEARPWTRNEDGSLQPAAITNKSHLILTKEEAKTDAANLESLLSMKRKPIKAAAKSVVIQTKFVEIGGGTEELKFDWVQEPFFLNKDEQDLEKNPEK